MGEDNYPTMNSPYLAIHLKNNVIHYSSNGVLVITGSTFSFINEIGEMKEIEIEEVEKIVNYAE